MNPNLSRNYNVNMPTIDFQQLAADQAKSNLHYTRSITSKRVTSGGSHLRGLTPGLHSSKETSQRWQAVGDNVPI